jgi:thiol-disulfide isomerase/thioredoxin
VAALDPGFPFPEIPLRDAKGATVEPPAGETLYVVFKTTCPTCELAWPYLERVRESTEGGLRVLAVSQDDPGQTRAFNRRLGSRVETVYDPSPWPASDRLGITNVPTFFRVAPGGRIEETLVGFDRERIREFARRGASLAGRPVAEIFPESEHVPALKPG